MTQLEGGGFEAQVAAWRDFEDESEVDVNQVPRGVDQNISVVPVFGLKQITRHSISAAPRQT